MCWVGGAYRRALAIDGSVSYKTNLIISLVSSLISMRGVRGPAPMATSDATQLTENAKEKDEGTAAAAGGTVVQG